MCCISPFDLHRPAHQVCCVLLQVPTGDRLAVRRTAQFFLNSFQERLEQQRKEKDTKGAAYNKDYKPQRTKEEAKEKRKQILANIGEVQCGTWYLFD